jgi:hypothetical protein
MAGFIYQLVGQNCRRHAFKAEGALNRLCSAGIHTQKSLIGIPVLAS